MVSYKTHGQYNFYPIAISLCLFAVMYWVSSWSKSFHVDEFLSWVYAERCTFTEILSLKDFGIGHPPLYHLLQKIVIEILPGYQTFYVRLVNFCVGLIFVGISANMIVRHGGPSTFAIAIGGCGGVLNAFVFARMYGLLCLWSILLIIFGERYARTGGFRQLLILFALCIFGFLSDYNFILLMPYLLLVLLSRQSIISPLKLMYSCFFIIITAAMILKLAIDWGDSNRLMYNWIINFPLSIPVLIYEITYTTLPFSFVEPFLISITLLMVAVAIDAINTKKRFEYRILAGGPIALSYF